MTTQLSKAELAKFAAASDDVRDDLKAAGAVVGGLPAAQLPGFQTQQAIADLNERWQEKANWGAGRWQYFAGAIRATSDNLTGTDAKAEFVLSGSIAGVAN